MEDMYSEEQRKQLDALRDQLIRGNPPGALAHPLSLLEGDPAQFKKQYPSVPGSGADAIKMPVTGGIGLTSVGAENPNLIGIKNTVNKGLGIIGDVLSGKYKWTGADLLPGGNAWDNQQQAKVNASPAAMTQTITPPAPPTIQTVKPGSGITPIEAPTTTGNIKPQFTKSDLSRKSDGSLPGGMGAGPVTNQSPARHPGEGFADQYAYAESLSPDQFKRFVDMHQDSPLIAGMGYIEAKDPKTGKMKLEKVISRPEERGGGNGMGGIDLSKATIGDLESIGPIINAMENRKENALYHRGLLETRQDEAATRKTIADSSLDEKKNVNFLNHLKALSTVGKDETNQPIYNEGVGYLKLLDQDQMGVIPEESRPAAKAYWDTRERQIMDLLKANKIKYNPDDINKPGTETYKHRKLAIDAIMRNTTKTNY